MPSVKNNEKIFIKNEQSTDHKRRQWSKEINYSDDITQQYQSTIDVADGLSDVKL